MIHAENSDCIEWLTEHLLAAGHLALHAVAARPHQPDDVQQLADQLGVEMRVAHSSSDCSKYKPIARRLFPHITRACQGMLFDTLDTVVTLMRKASTSTGLRTTVHVMRRHDETGRHATEHMKQNLKIVFDNLLPKWNYRAIPQHATVIN